MVYLFDIDGTILLTGGAGTRALNRVFQELHGIADAMAHVLPAGMTDPLIIEEIFETHLERIPTPDELWAVLDAYVPYLAEEVARAERFTIMPGAPEAVRFLAGEGICLGVATGNLRAAAEIKLARAALWDYFPFGGFGDDSRDRGELVARAIERARAIVGPDHPEEKIVVVGDTPRDVAAARACGVRVVCVPTGSYDRASLAAESPDALLETLWDLPDWHRAAVG